MNELMETFHTGKKKFLDGLPKYLRGLVEEEHQTQHKDIISYAQISNGEVTSLIQQVVLKVCRQDKMLRQLSKVQA
jgi:hypothetical protein